LFTTLCYTEGAPCYQPQTAKRAEGSQRTPMAEFHPQQTTLLRIAPFTYTFAPHPLFPDDTEEVFAIEGGEAVIYQVLERETGKTRALKVSKPSFRSAHIASATAALAPYANLPGLHLARRTCLTRQQFPDLIAQYPDLEYAILMPWLAGRTWAGFLADRTAATSYTSLTAVRLAAALGQALWDLEAHGLAHTDIAGGNVVLSRDLTRVELLDVEGLYMPGSSRPSHISQGSPGYQHRALDQRGQWRPEGDRFAGGIMLTEMLVWADPFVRSLTPPEADTLFQPDELQEINTQRWVATRDAIWTICPPMLDVFDRMWASADLSDCPELSAWAYVLAQARSKLPA